MKLIGVELHTPSATGLIAALITTAVFSALTIIVYKMLGVSMNYIVPSISGLMGGSIAAAYGAAEKGGWRGLVVTLMFGSIAMIIGAIVKHFI